MAAQRIRHLTAGALATAIAAATLAAAPKPLFNVSGRLALALKGYDAAAYATEGQAVRGSTAFEHQWSGATWRFATAANRDLFRRDPGRYAPQFGGYCAYAVSRGYTADVDPQAFRVVDGRLYLNYSKSVQRLWEANWPGVLGK